jgi:hypothetical protein
VSLAAFIYTVQIITELHSSPNQKLIAKTGRSATRHGKPKKSGKKKTTAS